MDERSKRRWLGGLVLFSLASLILPFVLTGDGARELQVQPTIPTLPQHLDNLALQVPEPSQGSLQLPTETLAKKVEAGLAVETENKQRAGSDKVQQDQNGTLIWSLQVQSFEQEKNAIRLRDELLKQGFQAYTRVAQTSRGRFFRVFVGPEMRWKSVQNLRATLSTKTGMQGLVVRYHAIDEQIAIKGQN